MMLGGFVAIIFGDLIDGIWIVILGWFIKSGAETSLRQTLVGETLTGVTVGNIMTRDVLWVPADITVQQLITDYFLVHPHAGYPVMRDGQLVGLVTLQTARSIPKDMRANETVAQAMIPIERAPTIRSTASALDALQKMARERVEVIPVTEGHSLLGILSRGDLMKTIQTRQELELHPTWQPPSTISVQKQVQYCIQCGAQLPAGSRTCPYCSAVQPQ
jgi:CBS domain-containing protein